MVPARFIGIAHIPLSPHGKVDRAALLDAYRNGPAGRGTAA
jgi:hypothetical protein